MQSPKSTEKPDSESHYAAQRHVFTKTPEIPYRKVYEWDIKEMPTGYIFLGTCVNCKTPGKVITCNMMYDHPSFCLNCVFKLFEKSPFTKDETIAFLNHQQIITEVNYQNTKVAKRDAKLALGAVKEQLCLFKKDKEPSNETTATKEEEHGN